MAIKYKLLKDLPTCKAGAIFVSYFKKEESEVFYKTFDTPYHQFSTEYPDWVLSENPDWFEPINFISVPR